MKKHKKLLITILLILLALTLLFFQYTSDYSRALSNAVETANTYSTPLENGDLYFEADDLENYTEDNLFIFYPGGKVEYTAYAPLIHKLQEKGQNIVLVKMPFNLAVFGKNKADDYLNQMDGIENYYLIGHSLGGAMASSYASEHVSDVDFLFLLGAYLYGDYPSNKQATIYGSNDLGLDQSKITYSDNILVIQGGNHAGFGYYGLQDGDGDLEITADDEQNQAVDYIMQFID